MIFIAIWLVSAFIAYWLTKWWYTRLPLVIPWGREDRKQAIILCLCLGPFMVIITLFMILSDLSHS